MKQPVLIALISLLSLLVSQGYWLYNIYSSERDKTQSTIDKQFKSSINIELSERIASGKPKDPDNPTWIIKSADEMSLEERNLLKGDTITLNKAKEKHVGESFVDFFNQRIQDGLLNQKPLQINVLDSIFNKQLAKEHIQASTLMILYGPNKQEIGRIGQLSPSFLNTFQTSIYPIGTRGLQSIQAFVMLPTQILFIKLFYTLIMSCMILLIAMGCFYFLLRAIRQSHLQLRERELAIRCAIHDLKAPLNTAYASMDLVANMERETVKADILNTGKTQIRRLAETLESMLSLLKTPDEYSQVKQSEIEITPMIEQTFQAIAQFYPNKKYSFQVEKEPRVPLIIYVDTIRLERCLRNLLENALKYSDDSVKVTTRISVNGDHLQIAIQDTGWGIPKKAQKKLGQQFFRVKQADKPPRSGYGLGLSSVKLLTKEMGGTLTFHSKEGVGSTFIINLPLNT